MEERPSKRQRRTTECHLRVSCSAKDLGEVGGGDQRTHKENKTLVGSFPTAEEAAMVYDEAARRLYGPEAYLNLPHLRSNFNPLNNSHKFKWMPSTNFGYVFPSTGLLNLNVQPSVHVIRQRLQELKKTGVLGEASTSSLSEPKNGKQDVTNQTQAENREVDEKDNDHKKLIESEEKPQIDLNEFLEQMGVFKRSDDQ